MKAPNDLKLSDGGVRRGTCMVGGKAAVEAGAVTHGAVRCSAWLGACDFMVQFAGFVGWTAQVLILPALRWPQQKLEE